MNKAIADKVQRLKEYLQRVVNDTRNDKPAQAISDLSELIYIASKLQKDYQDLIWARRDALELTEAEAAETLPRQRKD